MVQSLGILKLMPERLKVSAALKEQISKKPISRAGISDYLYRMCKCSNDCASLQALRPANEQRKSFTQRTQSVYGVRRKISFVSLDYVCRMENALLGLLSQYCKFQLYLKVSSVEKVAAAVDEVIDTLPIEYSCTQAT